MNLACKNKNYLFTSKNCRKLMLKAMCSCFPSKQLLQNASKKPQEVLQEESSSVSKHLRDVTVRIVHAGGRIEMFETAVPAAKLIRRYPGMCIARPDVFRHPHEAVLSAADVLLPGNKYFVVRCTTVEKLKLRKGRINEDDRSEESVCDKDYVVGREGWSMLRKHMKEKKFVPPIQRPRMWRESDWEPSLTSIKELSP